MQKSTARALVNELPSHINRIDLSGLIGYPLELYIHNLTSSTPLAWQSFSNGELLNQGEFLTGPGVCLEVLLGRQFFNSLPSSIKEICAIIPSLEYPLLQALLSSQAALELAQSNKLLFILAMRYAVQQQLDASAFLTLVQLKRTDILARLGFCSSKSLVKILARTALSTLHNYDLLDIESVLRSQELIEQLRHIQTPCLATFLLVNSWLPFSWPGLFAMLNAESDIRDVIHLKQILRDTLRMGASEEAVRRTQTLTELEQLHDHYLAQYNRRAAATTPRDFLKMYGAYPPPPLAGTSQIIPLSSWDELQKEGQEMHHCVGSYHSAVAERECFVYRVEGQKRLTLSIVPQRGVWVLDQLRGHCNAVASREDIDMVRSWLAQQ